MMSGNNYCEMDSLCSQCEYCMYTGYEYEPPPGDMEPPEDDLGELFDDCPMDQEGYERIMKLPRDMQHKLREELRARGFDNEDCDFSREEETKKRIFHAKYFTEEDEYGNRKSLLRQKDLNMTLDEQRFRDFAPEEMRMIYGTAEKGSRVNLMSFSMMPPRKVFDLDSNKQ